MTTSPLENHVTCRCSEVKVKSRSSCPQGRCRHASCVHENYVYIYAGKDGSIALKDFWRYNLGSCTWESVSFRGDVPHHLEGHSLVSYKKLLLLFGGEFGDSNTASSLWIINPDLGYVRRSGAEGTCEGPCVRRYHSAVVYGGDMFVFGGYVDINGSSNELWKYHIDDEEWERVEVRQPSRDQPGGLHGHTAVLYNKHMVVYGGCCDLSLKQDLWLYSFGLVKWMRVKVKHGPPPLSGHSAIVAGHRMFVYGGESHRQPLNHLWAFCFNSERWTQIILGDSVPSKVYHSALLITPEAQNYSAKASSMPYLQKNELQIHDLERPRSSPGERSNLQWTVDWFSNESQSSKHLDYTSQASTKQSINRPQVLAINSSVSGSDESIKILPSGSENMADRSPLFPNKMDINYNAIDLVDKNYYTTYGIDNPGVSNSTEELIRECNSRHSKMETDEVTEITRPSVFERSLSYVTEQERSEKHLTANTRVSARRNTRKSSGAKKSKLDSELVLEDLEYADSFPNDVKILYPSSKSLRLHRGHSSDSLLSPSMMDSFDTIELQNSSLTKFHNHTRSHEGVLSLKEEACDSKRSNMDHAKRISPNVVRFNKQTEQVQFSTPKMCFIGSDVDKLTSQKQHKLCGQDLQARQKDFQMGSGDGPKQDRTLHVKETSFSSAGANGASGQMHHEKGQQPTRETYMLVLGGRDEKIASFGFSPLQMWKFQISPL